MLQRLKSRKAIIIIAVLMLLLSVRVVIKHHQRQAAAMQDAVMVDADVVKTANMPIEVHVIGNLVAANNTQITPEIAGHVAKIFFRDGGVFVKQGTPLVQLDDAAYKAKLESDKANLIYSEADYNRKALLGKRGAIAQQAIDQALADLKTKQASVQQSQVEVNKMLLTAPFDGVLGKFNISPGDYVTVGQKIVSLTDTQHLHVEYSISEKYLSQLKQGQKIKITTSAYPGKEFTGTVAFISPTINNDDRTIALYAEVPNDQHLLTSGLYVDVTQELGAENNALIVSADSLVPTIDGQQVFKIVDHKVVAVAVKVGQHMQNTVQILSGLAVGDRVVVAGQQKLKDGTQVQINQPEKKS